MNESRPEQPTLLFISDADGVRLDRFLTSQGSSELFSRSFVERLIAEGHVQVNGKPARKSHKVSAGEQIGVWLPTPEPRHVVPQEFPLEVLFEDEYLAVVNKPAGMSVHPGPGHSSGTFANALAFRFARLAAGHGEMRPGMVHRLDKDTSGLLLVAKDDRTHSLCSTLFRQREVTKMYYALLLGSPLEDSGSLETGIGRHSRERKRMAIRDDGKRAVSHWQVQQRAMYATYVHVRIETGRTHQIRVHMEHTGYPVLGDRTYSTAKRELSQVPDCLHKRMRAIQKKYLQRQMLHAAHLAFTHPCTGERVQVTTPMPTDMQDAWQALQKLEL